MKSFGDCLKKHGLNEHENAILTAKHEQLLGEKYDAYRAAVMAVTAYRDDLLERRAAIYKEIGPEAPAREPSEPSITDEASASEWLHDLMRPYVERGDPWTYIAKGQQGGQRDDVAYNTKTSGLVTITAGGKQYKIQLSKVWGGWQKEANLYENPTPEEIAANKQAKVAAKAAEKQAKVEERKKAAKEARDAARGEGMTNNVTLKKLFQKIGINIKERSEITGEKGGGAKKTGAMVGTFRQSGESFDLWGRRLIEQKWMLPESQNERGNENMYADKNAVYAFMRRVFNGDEIFKVDNMAQNIEAIAEEEIVAQEVSPEDVNQLLDDLQDFPQEMVLDQFDLYVEAMAAGITDDAIIEDIGERAAVRAENGEDYAQAARSEIANRAKESRAAPDTQVDEGQEAEAPAIELVGQTPAEVKAAEDKAKADAEAKAKEEAKPSGPKVRVDQADIFNTQDTLFPGGIREVAPAIRRDDLLEPEAADKRADTLEQQLTDYFGPEGLKGFKDLDSAVGKVFAKAELMHVAMTGQGIKSRVAPEKEGMAARLEQIRENYESGFIDLTELYRIFPEGSKEVELKNGVVAAALKLALSKNPAFIQAVQANLDARDYVDNPSVADIWKKIVADKNNPIVRVEFENTVVFATAGEAISYKFGMGGDVPEKTAWGRLMAVRALEPNDSIDATRVTYIPLEGNFIRQRQVTRNEFKVALGDRGVRLVNNVARAPSLRAYLIGTPKLKFGTTRYSLGLAHGAAEQGTMDDDADYIINVLRMTPQEFYKAVHEGAYDRLATRVLDTKKHRRLQKSGRFFFPTDKIVTIPDEAKAAEREKAAKDWADYLLSRKAEIAAQLSNYKAIRALPSGEWSRLGELARKDPAAAKAQFDKVAAGFAQQDDLLSANPAIAGVEAKAPIAPEFLRAEYEALISDRRWAKQIDISIQSEIDRAKDIFGGRKPTKEDVRWFLGRAKKFEDMARRSPKIASASKEVAETLKAIAEAIKAEIARPAEPMFSLGNIAESIQAKPGANIPRIGKLLGHTLYGDPGDMQSVTVKELLQNSFDGVRSLLRNGALAEGKIEIETDSTERTVTMIDNGLGMSPEILSTKFLEIAGTHKEGDRSSGGFGVAKMQFLYGNKEIEVKTLRDGVLSTLKSTGDELSAALGDPSMAPNIEVERHVKDTADFPDGHGTLVKVTIPKSWIDPTTGTEKTIDFWNSRSDFRSLALSPLFENVEVTFNGSVVQGIGKTFQTKDFAPVANVDFGWGTARIYAGRQEESLYGDNVHVLSNGIWQFSMRLTKNPMDMWSDPLPRTFYLDLDSKARPEDPGYPFAPNRQAFSPITKKGFNSLLGYIGAMYRSIDMAKDADNFGSVQYLEKPDVGVSVSAPVSLKPEKGFAGNLLTAIKPSDEIVLENGRLIVNGSVVPTLTTAQLQGGVTNLDQFKMEQDSIPYDKVVLHDNMVVRADLVDMLTSEAARDKFGFRFDRFVYAIGNTFKELRDEVAKVMDYPELAKEPVGISFDTEYRGVSIRIPFSASFLNIAAPEETEPRQAALGFFGTMLHELAHYKRRSHDSDMVSEMQRITLRLEGRNPQFVTQIKKDLLSAVERNHDILVYLNGLQHDSNSKPSGKRFVDSSNESRRGNAAEDVAASGADGRPGRGVSTTVQDGVEAAAQGTGYEAPSSPAARALAAFKRWFGDSKVVDAQGNPLRVYHGAQRPDRIGTVFRKSRATSGPMAFFTDDPEIASGYAKGKADTSRMREDANYHSWFKMRVGRTKANIDRAWYFLTSEQRAKIAELAPRVSQDDAGQGVLELKPAGHKTGLGGYDQHIKEAKGNHLAALVEEWLNSGSLFNREEEFMDVLRMAGMPMQDVEMDFPDVSYPSVYPVYLSIRNPLRTSEIPEAVVAALERAAKRQRGPKKEFATDIWDKNNQDPREWVNVLKYDLEKGTNLVWTSIPDWVTKTLRSLGYDGIQDAGQKFSTNPDKHAVWIPFDETQVKSATGNRGTWDPTKKDIRFLVGARTAAGLAKARVEQFAAALRKQWNNAPPIVVVERASDLPFDTPKTARGAYWNGAVYLVSENLTGNDAIQHVLLHETFGHYGLAGVLGDALNSVMENIYQTNDYIRKEADRRIAHYREKGREISTAVGAEEAIADMAAEGRWSQISGWQMLFAQIRNALRKVGFTLKMSNAEVAVLLGNARRYVREGPQQQIMGEAQPALSLGQVASDAFKQWFGDSKVVDAEGKPLLVYHGTKSNNAIAQFRVPAYFTEDPKWANTFGDKATYPVYLKIERPYRLNGYVDGSHFEWDAEDVARMKSEGYDGVIIDRNGEDIYTVFDKSQIKSATGNRGTFDPNNPDVRFSLGQMFTLPDDGPVGTIKQHVLDRLRFEGKSMSWINKSINTPYHLAETNKWFRPIYEGVQQFISDVTTFANDAAELAGEDILPRLQNWHDVIFNPFSFSNWKKQAELRKDLREVGKVLWAGTLGEIRPTEAQLRAGFTSKIKDTNGNEIGDVQAPPLNDTQIEHYRRVRKTLDLSIDQGIVSEMAKLTRESKRESKLTSLEGARILAKGDPTNGAEILLAALYLRLDEITDRNSNGTLSDADAKKLTESTQDTIEKIEAKQAIARKLQDEGYAPLMRFGQYTVTISERTPNNAGGFDDNNLYFGMFETKKDANRMARDMLAEFQKTNPLAELRLGTMDTESWKVMRGLSLDTLEAFADAAGIDREDAVQKYYKMAVASRSALKRLIHRKGMAGYDEDMQRVLATFVTSQARYAARNYHYGELTKSVAAIPTEYGETRGYATQLLDYVQFPNEEAQAVRGFLFVQFIGGSIASALVNISQPLLTTVPWLSQYEPARGALGIAKSAGMAVASVTKALAIVAKGTSDPDLKRAMDKAAKEGRTEPQEIHQLHAEAIRSGLGGNSLQARKMLRLWSAAFSLAESFNRKVTFAAAYEMANSVGMGPINAIRREQGKEEFATPYEFAVSAIAETQFIYNKGNRPALSRGSVMATVMTFKQFAISYIEFLSRLPGREKFLALAILGLAAGAEGMPFSEDLMDLWDTIWQAMGYNANAKKSLRNVVVKTVGETAGGFLMGGVSGIPGSPIDLSGRLGFGNLLPGTSIFKRSTTDASREVAQAMGPLGSVLMSARQAFAALEAGQPKSAIYNVVPKAVRDAMQAFDMAQAGYYRDLKGRRVIDTTAADAAFKAIGLMPYRVAHEGKFTQGVMQDRALHNVVEASIADRWAKGIVDKDPEAVQDAIKEMFAWNLRNPDLRIVITPQQIRQRVQSSLMTREQRLFKSTPREIRAQEFAR